MRKGKWYSGNNETMKKWTDNDIGESGARMISESLKTNTTLTEMNLYSDTMMENEVEFSGTKQWKNKMIKNKWLNDYIVQDLFPNV